MAALGIVVTLGQSTTRAKGNTLPPAGNNLIAIDVLLELDRMMVVKANALNNRLRGDYPAGYSLDATHSPHVSMLQRFVRATDLDAVTAAVAKVLAAERPTDLQLTAKGIDYVMWAGVAVTVLLVERTPELLRLEEKIVDAVTPFSVSGGTAAAFVGADANAETIAYVETFVPKSSGTNHSPRHGRRRSGSLREAAEDRALPSLQLQAGRGRDLPAGEFWHRVEEALAERRFRDDCAEPRLAPVHGLVAVRGDVFFFEATSSSY